MSVNEKVLSCEACNKNFNLLRWRHLCEKCQKHFCSNCLCSSQLFLNDKEAHFYKKCCPECLAQNKKLTNAFFDQAKKMPLYKKEQGVSDLGIDTSSEVMLNLSPNDLNFFYSIDRVAKNDVYQVQSNLEDELKIRAAINGFKVVYDVEFYYEISKRSNSTKKLWGVKSKIANLKSP